MRVSEISKRYAKAFLAATKQKGVHVAALAELKAVGAAMVDDTNVKSFFENPTISAEQKAKTLKAAFAGMTVSDETLNTLALLIENNRSEIIGQVVLALQELLDTEEGITRGEVRSAQPLSAEAQKTLENKIGDVLKKKIVLTFKQDPKLLGGVVVDVGGWTFDDSIDTHLKKLNEELNRRAN